MRQVLALLLCCALAAIQMPAQNVSPYGTKETDSRVISSSGTTVTFPDAGGTLSNTFEFIVAGTPATLACTVSGVMAGSTSTALGTTSGTANQVLNLPGGPYTNFTVTCAWTGGSSPTVTVNRVGATAALSAPSTSTLVLNSARDCAGASLDARVASCVTKLAGKCGVVDSRSEGNQTLAASMTTWQACMEWLPPLGTLTFPTNTTITIPYADGQVTIWCDILDACTWDGSNNGSQPTLTAYGNQFTLHGVKILGGRLNSQTGTEVVVGQDNVPTSGDVIEANWIVNAGTGAIVTHAISASVIRGNITEQAAGPGIQTQCGDSNVIDSNWIYDAEILKYAGSGDMDLICQNGPYQMLRLTVSNNHVMNGLLGPTVLGTNNGGGYGTATVTTGSTTVTYSTGSSFVSTGLWSLQHMVLNGVDQQIASCASATTCTLSAAYADVQNFPVGGCGGGCVVPFTVYMVPANPAYQLAAGSTGANTGVSATHNSAQVTLTNGFGTGNTLFLATMAANSWTITISGVNYTIQTFTNSTTVQITPVYAGTTATNLTWQAYPTPTQSMTGAGECYQATAPADGLIYSGNQAFNCVDEGFTAGNGSFVAVGNTVENNGQGCNGCAAIIDAVQSGSGQQDSVSIGPASITGNTMKATATFGIPATGQSGFSNASGKIGFFVWLNIATPATGNCKVSDVIVSGNVGTAKFGGTAGIGFKYSNGSTAPCTAALSNVVLASNAWSGAITTPVSIDYTHTSGTVAVGYPDNGGVMMLRAFKPTNQNFSSVTPANITAFNFTGLQAATAYTIDCNLAYSAVATGGLVLTLSGPAAPTLVTQQLMEPTSANTANYQATTGAAFGTTVGVVVVTATTGFPTHYHATFNLGTAGGTVNVQAASTAAVAVTVYAGSECDLLEN